MAKTFSIIFVFLFLVSCNEKNDCVDGELNCSEQVESTQTSQDRPMAGKPAVANPAKEPASPVQLPPVIITSPSTPVITQPNAEDVPASALSWDADIYMVNFNTAQEAKVNKAVELIKKIVGSKKFKDRVLGYTYKGKTQFVDNDGFTNAEVYQKILDGAEEMGNRTKNNTMDVELELYHENTSTIGYTYPNTVRVWMNTKFFNNYSEKEVADNLMHEWTHKLGFTHAAKWSEKRDHSVPYAIGYLIEEIAGEI